jgi:hypothetical protein
MKKRQAFVFLYIHFNKLKINLISLFSTILSGRACHQGQLVRTVNKVMILGEVPKERQATNDE